MTLRRFAPALLSLALLAGCAVPLQKPPERFREGTWYTAVAFRPYRGDKIGFTNFLQNTEVIPPGTPVRVPGMNVEYLVFDVNGVRYFMEGDPGRAWNLALAPQLVDKYVAESPPELPDEYGELNATPREIPAGVAKEDLVLSLGYPALADGRVTQNMRREDILASDDWIYYFNVWRVRMRVRFTDGVTDAVDVGG